MSTNIRVASFFTGIGGFDLGFEHAGMKVVFQVEINKFCQKVLRKHWPDIPLWNDINTLEPENIPDAELWCGGFPCQDLSLANQGKRKGLEGARSGLFYKFAQLIDNRRPKWVVIENVPGLLNSHSGDDFKILLETLDEFGYGVSWRILDAKYFGTPQRRRRTYIVGSLGTLFSAQVLFEHNATQVVYRQGLGKKDFTSNKTQIGVGDSNIYSIQHATIGRKASAGPQAKGYRNDGETYNLDSRGSADAVCSTVDAFGVREVTGVPAGLDGNRYRAIGNAVAVPVIEWIGNRIAAVDKEWIDLEEKDIKTQLKFDLDEVKE
jgi:DNA (cytosine-5)-methyltransferase 1